MSYLSRSGGIGIHKGLKIPRLEACGFEPRLRHQLLRRIYDGFMDYNRGNIWARAGSSGASAIGNGNDFTTNTK